MGAGILVLVAAGVASWYIRTRRGRRNSREQGQGSVAVNKTAVLAAIGIAVLLVIAIAMLLKH